MESKRILVVDDDEDLVEALRTILESAGYTVDSAGNSKDAWERIRQARPDLMMLDVMMDSVGEGLQLALELRGDERLKGVPIIMLTAVNQAFPLHIGPETEEGYLPVDKFVEKPVEPAELLKMISELTG